jgi:hypothetical protein
MKAPYYLLPLAACCATASLSAQEGTGELIDAPEKIRYQLILPEEKIFEQVKPNEPNPFNKGDLSELEGNDTTSEENAIKAKLENMPVSGVQRDAQGEVISVMLGDMRLKQNMAVPSVLADQSVHLRVNALSVDAVELLWVEKKGRSRSLQPPKPIVIPINGVTNPVIKFKLPSAGSAPPAPKPGDPATDNSTVGRRVMPSFRDSAGGVADQPAERAKPVDSAAAAGAPPAPKAAPAPEAAPPVTTPEPAKAPHAFNALMNLLSAPKPTQQTK